MKLNKPLSVSIGELQILLFAEDPTKVTALAEALADTQYHIHSVIDDTSALLDEVNNHWPDVIIIDVERPSAGLLEHLHQMSLNSPKPVVMFADHQDSDIVNALVKSGVSAYIAGEFNPNRVQSILDIAIARFSQYQQLKQELVTTKEKLTSQKTIEQAKIWLMETKHYSEKEAYQRMRKTAMDNSQKLEQVAKNILSLATMLENTP